MNVFFVDVLEFEIVTCSEVEIYAPNGHYIVAFMRFSSKELCAVYYDTG
jgi:hypothetical protein